MIFGVSKLAFKRKSKGAKTYFLGSMIFLKSKTCSAAFIESRDLILRIRSGQIEFGIIKVSISHDLELENSKILIILSYLSPSL